MVKQKLTVSEMLNARKAALDYAIKIDCGEGFTPGDAADRLVSAAKKIEAYLLSASEDFVLVGESQADKIDAMAYINSLKREAASAVSFGPPTYGPPGTMTYVPRP